MQHQFIVAVSKLLVGMLGFLFVSISHAGNPLWTFSADPNNPPTISISAAGSATIKYVVTNQSLTPHTLAMNPVAGITQITTAGNCPNPVTLAYQQSCTLNLLVNGSALTGNVNGGPTLCQLGSSLQCYQPSQDSILNITLMPMAVTLYAGTLSGNLYYSIDNGLSWSTTTVPSSGFAVNGIYATPSMLYVASGDGKIYYSSNNGALWNTTSPVPDGTSANSVYVAIVNLI